MLQRLHAGLAWRCRQTFVLENLTSYELHFFETYLVAPTAVSLKCCGFCGFGQVHFLLETTGKETAPQKRRSQCPKCPFCTRSGHQSSDIQVLGTILLKCTQSTEACCTVLDKNPDLLVLSYLPSEGCSH